MKRAFFLFAVILLQNSFAQPNSKIYLFVIDNGSLKQKNSNTYSLSTAGQSIIGTSKGTNSFVLTGFSAQLKFSHLVTSSEAEENTLPPNFSLFQNYPNPFNPSTKIRYTIPSSTSSGGSALNVVLKVYNILGKEIAILVNENKPAGSYSVEFDASSLASGIYIYKLVVGGFVETKKMILLR